VIRQGTNKTTDGQKTGRALRRQQCCDPNCVLISDHIYQSKEIISVGLELWIRLFHRLKILLNMDTLIMDAELEGHWKRSD